MQKLRVTWQDGSWNREGDQPVASADVPAGVGVKALSEDSLVFVTGGGQIHLVIPCQRLISAVLVDVEDPA